MSRVLPILFNTEMVRAILDGRKKATRRLVMPHNRKKAKEQGYRQGSGLWVDPSTDNGDREGHIKDYSISDCWMRTRIYIQKYAPYQPGDTLYVRETWAFLPCVECMRENEDCGRMKVTYKDKHSESEGCFVYRADHPHPNRVSWTPSIHMPKEAARIWIKVSDVRVERLQDITDIEAEKEGAQPQNPFDYDVDKWPNKEHFKEIWNSTIKKSELDLYGWDAIPWVWVIEFERCEKPKEWAG